MHYGLIPLVVCGCTRALQIAFLCAQTVTMADHAPLISLTMLSEAEQYSQQSRSLQQRDGLDLIENIHLEESGSLKVLDLGCGTGYLSSVLARKFAPNGNVIAVDPDEERIRIAAESYGCDRISFLEGSSSNFPSDQYDLVFSNYVLQWIKNKDSVFECVHANLKPGGQFAFIAVTKQPSILLQLGDLMGPATSQRINEKFEFMPCEFYDSLASKYGFLVEFVDTTPSRISFPSVSSLMEWWFATTHGMFNPRLLENSSLDAFTKIYEGQNVEFDIPIAKFILKKC